MRVFGLGLALVWCCMATGPAVEMKRTCTRCHSLDVVRAQRLSREEWESELDKMGSMGAKIRNRAALLAYLTEKFGPETKRPVARTSVR